MKQVDMNREKVKMPGTNGASHSSSRRGRDDHRGGQGQ